MFTISAAPTKGTEGYFFKNADHDEVIFIHKGSGEFRTVYGSLYFKYGDYIMVPRGTVYQLHFDSDDNRLLIIESTSPLQHPDITATNMANC